MRGPLRVLKMPSPLWKTRSAYSHPIDLDGGALDRRSENEGLLPVLLKPLDVTLQLRLETNLIGSMRGHLRERISWPGMLLASMNSGPSPVMATFLTPR